MPRPKLHLTAAQKREAVCQKHAKYYQKHKGEIKNKRMERKMVTAQPNPKQSRSWNPDEDQKSLGASVKSGNSKSPPKYILPEQPIVLAAQKWEGKAQRLYDKLCALFGESKTYHEFCESVYHRYMSKEREDTRLLDKAHSGMESYRSLFMTYKLKLLEEVGQEDEYYRVQRMEDAAFMAASGVSDMLCEAIMGVENLKSHYERRSFGFQKTAPSTHEPLRHTRPLKTPIKGPTIKEVLPYILALTSIMPRSSKKKTPRNMKQASNGESNRASTRRKQVFVAPLLPHQQSFIKAILFTDFYEFLHNELIADGINWVFERLQQAFPGYALHATGTEMEIEVAYHTRKEDIRKELYRCLRDTFTYRRGEFLGEWMLITPWIAMRCQEPLTVADYGRAWHWPMWRIFEEGGYAPERFRSSDESLEEILLSIPKEAEYQRKEGGYQRRRVLVVACKKKYYLLEGPPSVRRPSQYDSN
ncbi:hypothetical protein PQX77_013718 [Marasmius sp. AFHP31]|nr:hypothetical protein PQX77_013718 [Marasmius sp. AFHP31]